MKVEVAVLDSPSQKSLHGLCRREAALNLNCVNTRYKVQALVTTSFRKARLEVCTRYSQNVKFTCPLSVNHLLLECLITTELLKGWYDLAACENVRGILYNTDIINSAAELIVHSPMVHWNCCRWWWFLLLSLSDIALTRHEIIQ